MTSRGHSTRDDRDDRRRPVRDDRVPIRDDPPASSRGGRGETLNEFFVDGKGIHREVLQREICKYLGPEAYSRPYNYNGVSGYTITAVRPFTSKMLDDLQDLSRSYEAENRQAIRRGQQDIPYVNSRTHQQAVLNQGPEDPYDQGAYQGRTPYTMASAQPTYVTSSRSEYPPTQAAAYPGPLYPQGPSYAQGAGYPAGPTYPGTARPNTQDAYNAPYDAYRDDSPRPSYPGGTRQVRVDPRMDPRDPRLDPRADPRAPDPRAYAGADPRLDPRDMRDPRTDPRMMSNYSYSVNSPADVPMRGYNDDYVNAPIQMGRGGGTYAPTRPVQTGYDSRESPQMRDAYRHEPIREERRSRR